MKFTSYLVAIVLALVSVQAASSPTTNLRGLQGSGPEMLDFAAVNQLASFNGLHAGEQILEAVNDALPDMTIDGGTLLDIAKQLQAKDPKLETADMYTQKVVTAVRKAFAKLFPSETFEAVLNRVLPKIPDSRRRLDDATPIESIDFSDSNQLASFNGVHAGEQILAAVNKIVQTDGEKVISVAQKLAANDSSLETADDATKKVTAAFKQVVAQLFPGESFADVLKRLLPLIPATRAAPPCFLVVAALALATVHASPAASSADGLRRLNTSAPTKNLNFRSLDQSTPSNALLTGEKILAEINKTVQVDSGKLLAVAHKLESNAAALDSADVKTKEIAAALKQVVAKLFPGEPFANVLKRLLPLIPTKV